LWRVGLSWQGYAVFAGLTLLGTLAGQSQSRVDVLAWHNNDARTGQNLRETILTLGNVNTNTFGKLFSYSVDGWVYAQPLCLSDVNVPGQGPRNLVFVATEHDSVYAFDADDGEAGHGQPVWHVSFADPTAGITSVPTEDVGVSEPPELGITGTPVIDPASGTLYVVAHTKEVADNGEITYPQRLHALDVGTAQEKFGGPVLIDPVSPGTGAGSTAGQVSFDWVHDFQRPGLALANGIVYSAFASAGDIGEYHGWVLGYDAQTLKLTNVFNDTPNGGQGGIWMSGGAPSVDAQGNLYVMTGNGTFDGVSDFGDSFIKLTASSSGFGASDYFTPYNQAKLDSEDGDLGSGGPMLLPDEVGSPAHPHLLVGCGKEGTIYLVDRDNMGHYKTANNSQIVQSLPLVIGGTWGNPAYFNGWIYYQGTQDPLKAFSISNAQLSEQPVSQNVQSIWQYPNGTPSISANGTADGIVWLIETDTFYQSAPAILHAYNATNLDQEIYNSNQAGPRDQAGVAQKFAVPVIANGKVYVQSAFGLTVYGNLGQPTFVTQPASQAALPGTTVTLRTALSGPGPFTYRWQRDGTDLAGQTNATLVLTNAMPEQTGIYALAASNLNGSVSSAPANVLIAAAPRLSIDSDKQLLLTGTGGITYRVEFLGEFGAASWVPLTQITLPGDPTQPEDAQASFDDPFATGDQRFYRATILLPTSN
jgi:hypothetical protein